MFPLLLTESPVRLLIAHDDGESVFIPTVFRVLSGWIALQPYSGFERIEFPRVSKGFYKGPCKNAVAAICMLSVSVDVLKMGLPRRE